MSVPIAGLLLWPAYHAGEAKKLLAVLSCQTYATWAARLDAVDADLNLLICDSGYFIRPFHQ